MQGRNSSATFLPILAYGDVVYQHTPSCRLSSLDAVYHGALRVITDCKHLTHDCTVYSRVAWSSLAVRRKMHWYLMICKAICFFLPQYLCCLIQQKSQCTFQCIIISMYLLLELIWVLRLLNMLPLRLEFSSNEIKVKSVGAY